MKYEIEIKSFLGEEEKANFLRDNLLKKGALIKSKNSQLNHYFINGDFNLLLSSMKEYLSEEKYGLLKKIVDEGRSISTRTREIDGVVKLVLKASIDSTTSENGIARMEFEEDINLSLNELDNILINSDFEYQAKWSRNREEYDFDGINVCLDKNAGYGWLAEFEKIIGEDEDKDEAELHLRKLMSDFGVEELSQDRLARMFDYYNNNWEDYYGTDNIFNIE